MATAAKLVPRARIEIGETTFLFGNVAPEHVEPGVQDMQLTSGPALDTTVMGDPSEAILELRARAQLRAARAAPARVARTMGREIAGRVARAVGIAACLLVTLSLTNPASAENDEIEIRLKTAGVSPVLRTRVHAAIERGITFLLAQQSKSGAIRGPHPRYGRHDIAYTTLAALALAHSGGSDARAGADRAIDWLITDKGAVRAGAMTQSYEIGMLGMLLQARMRHPDVAEQIVRQVARGLDQRTAWWGYGVGSGESGGPALIGAAGRPNLSTTQFAGLGLWAASKVSGKTSRSTWRAHMESLLRTQAETGSWGYGASNLDYPDMATAYPTGTCMGIANLLLARAALEEELPYDPVLAARVEIAVRRGMDALDTASRAILDGATPAHALSFYYYGMYAMEKACVFADVDELNGLRWYVTGAQQLIALQHENGAWGHGAVGTGRERFEARGDPDVLATSFALLFLLRTSEVYRPTTPRGVPTPPAAVTGGARNPETEFRDPDPESPAHVTISTAAAQVDRLWRLLKDDTTRVRHLVEAVEEIAHTQTVIVPDTDADTRTGAEQATLEAAINALRERIERALLKAFTKFEGPGHDAGEAIAVAAARGLAHARPTAVDDLRKALGADLRASAAQFPSMPRLFAAMHAIARSDHEGHVRWVAGFISANADPRSVRLSRAALTALGSVNDAPGPERFRAFRTLIKQLAPLEVRAAAGGDDRAALVAEFHWRALSAPTIFALSALARDPASGNAAQLPSGLPPMSVAEFTRWFDDHAAMRAPPWTASD